jgi:hypothetical protein
MAKNLNTQIQTQTQISQTQTQAQTPQTSQIQNLNQIEKLKEILRKYINDEIGIYSAAEEIVDTSCPWDKYYLPLFGSATDPWQRRSDDIISIENMIDACSEITDSDEEFIQCTIDAITQSSDP